VQVSRQEAHVTPGEPAASTFGATDESEEDVVFIPPPRGRRGAKSTAPAASKTAAKKTAAKKSVSTRSASKTRKKK
jgi:ribonuclease R